MFIEYNVQWFIYIMNKIWFNNHMFRINYNSYFFYWRHRSFTRVKSLFEICRYEYMTMTIQFTQTRKLTFKSHHLIRRYRKNFMICERLKLCERFIFFKLFMLLFECFTLYENLHICNKKKHLINYVEKILSFFVHIWQMIIKICNI